jgi:hypothetical protein
VKAGVFPPMLDEDTNCPHLPLSFNAAPGSSFHGRHSYPGGLPIHEANNDQSDINFTDLYRGSYGSLDPHGTPVFDGKKSEPGAYINQDVLLAAPMWHDWGKTMVFQWNADGTEFTELNFGGAGTNDAWGAPGDSRTGGHHIISIAESMTRGMPPELVITQASAYSAPTSGNEYKGRKPAARGGDPSSDRSHCKRLSDHRWHGQPAPSAIAPSGIGRQPQRAGPDESARRVRVT